MTRSKHPSLSAIPGLIDEIKRVGEATEAQVVREIRRILHLYGFQEPPHMGTRGYYVVAGQWNARGSGSTAGVPDMLILTPARAYPIEVKPRLKTGRISPNQFAMWEAGCLHIVNSGEQVLAVLGLK